MTIKGLLFDKDGTLISFEDTFGPATHKVLHWLSDGDQSKFDQAAQAFEFDPVAMRFSKSSVVIAGSTEELATALAPVFEFDDIGQFTHELDRLYGKATLESIEFLPGVLEALTEMANAGYVLGIATNDAEENARQQMRHLGAEHLFDQILGADSGHGAKPGPGMADAFVRHAGVSSREVAVVGDSLHDLNSGREAGCITIAVETGPADREILQPFCDLVIGSAAELPSLLDSGQTIN